MRTNAIEKSSAKNELMNESINQSINQSCILSGRYVVLPYSFRFRFLLSFIGRYTGSCSSRIKALAEISEGFWDIRPFSQSMKENLSPCIMPAKYMEVEKVNLLIRILGTVVP